jgi:hypothetical protein
MRTPDWEGLLREAHADALRFLEGLPGRSIQPAASRAELRRGLGGALPEGPSDPREVITQLAGAPDRGLFASTSGRFFGYVMGGALPAVVGAEWLTVANSSSIVGASPPYQRHPARYPTTRPSIVPTESDSGSRSV